MKNKLLLIITLTLLIVPIQLVSSYNWPVNDPVITSTFGADKWETYGSGIELYGEGLEVKPAENGEMIFYEDLSSYSNLPSGLGNFAVIEHDRKLRTLYASIDPSLQISEFNTVSTADVLGTTGLSGKAVVPHLYFAVIDSEFEQWVNPLLLLNSIVDNKVPVIREIGISGDDGYISIDKKAIVSSGTAEILAEIYDPCMLDDFYCPLSPFKIQLFNNGEEIFYINFESMRFENGDAIIQSHNELTYKDFYRYDGFVSLGDISLVPGNSRFELLVSDYSGNETGYTFQLTVIE